MHIMQLQARSETMFFSIIIIIMIIIITKFIKCCNAVINAASHKTE